MNHRKHTSSLGFPSLVLLIIAVVIVSASGIGYVVMKNKQITARGKIAEIQHKMDEHNVSIALHSSDIEETLGYSKLREQLVDLDLPLIEIKYVEPYRDADEVVSESSVAQR